MFSDQDKSFMRLALEEANKSLIINEVPVGSVVVRDNEVVGSNNMLPPVVFGMGDNQAEDDMAELEMHGFTHLQ